MPEPFDFSKISAADGWHVVFIERRTYCSLSLELRIGEVPVPIHGEETFVTLGEWRRPTDTQRGEIARLHRLAEALCRYFNAGGDLIAVQDLLDRLCYTVGPMDAFAGWDYHDCFVDTNANYTHVWVSQAEPKVGVVWTEDVFVYPPKPWDELKDSLYAEPEEAEESRAGPEPPARPPRLQLGQDPQ